MSNRMKLIAALASEHLTSDEFADQLYGATSGAEDSAIVEKLKEEGAIDMELFDADDAARHFNADELLDNMEANEIAEWCSKELSASEILDNYTAEEAEEFLEAIGREQVAKWLMGVSAA